MAANRVKYRLYAAIFIVAFGNILFEAIRSSSGGFLSGTILCIREERNLIALMVAVISVLPFYIKKRT
jgi:hypothetical protein